MKNLFLGLLTMVCLSNNSFAANMDCAGGSLKLNLQGLSTTGFATSQDIVLTAKGKFTENGPTATSTRIEFQNGRVRFVTYALMTGLIIQHDINFTSIIKHQTTSANGEWSSYVVEPGLFNKGQKTSTYLEVNNFNNTATIFRSLSESNTWKCN